MSYRLLGTAQSGSDYSGASSGTISFSAGSATAELSLPALADSVVDPGETIIAQIVPSPTATPSYLIIPGQQTATATINAEGMVVAVKGPSRPGWSKGEVSNVSAFAALKSDGTVVSWGGDWAGGTTPAGLGGVTQIFSNDYAFAALKSDGTVVSWGADWAGGTTPAGLGGVTQIFSTVYAFAALKSDGTVVSWGDPDRGGTTPAGLSGVTQIFSTGAAFAALKSDGTVVSWGLPGYSGTTPAGLSGVTQIFSTDGAFAALKSDGTIVSWGIPGYGGTTPAGLGGVTHIFFTDGAFAALKSDGTVVSWGIPGYGGTTPAGLGGVTQIFSASNAFAALKSDGTVVCWGDPDRGGTTPAGLGDVIQIFSNHQAFAALKSDGTVVCWGDPNWGGTTPVGLGSVTQIFSTIYAFAALKSDGTVVSWGDPSSGGTTPAGLSGVVGFANPLTDDRLLSPQPLLLPSITLAVAPAAVAEDGSSNLVYTFTRTGATTSTLTVNYGITGTADAADYTGATPGDGKTIAFAAGSATATLTINPTVDATIEPDETVSLTLALAAGKGYTIGTTAAVTGTIVNDDLPVITLDVSPAAVVEDRSSNLVYTFTRTGPTTSALTVNYGITGTADATDYTGATPGAGKTITFAAGSATATLAIDPTIDTTIEPDEAVSLSLAGGTDYTTGTTAAVTGTIVNDDFPVITLAVAPAAVVEDGSSNLVYTFTRTRSTTSALTVNYDITGTADATDYTGATPGAGKTITFAAGSATATLTINPTVDATIEPDETVSLSLAAGTGYNIGTTAAVTGTIVNDETQVSVTAIANGNEANGSPAVFRFSRTGSTTAPLSVSYRLLGTAQAGSDYSGATTGTISFSAGSATAELSLPAIADSVVDPGETIIAQIVPSPTATPSYVITPDQQTATATITAEGMVVTVNGPSRPGLSKGEIRNGNAFAALKSDGTVVSWGDPDRGGTTPAGLGGVTQIFSSYSAFAALKSDGTVVSWGDPSSGGTTPAGLSGVTQIFPTGSAFAALRSDGTVVSWGDPNYDGTTPAGLSDVTQIFSAGGAFAALKSDGTVVSWGDTNWVGTTPAGLSGVTQIFSTGHAFAALKSDGTVISWGSYEDWRTGTITPITIPVGLVGVTQIFSNHYAFAALKSDGTVVCWGYPYSGGTTPAGLGGVTKIFSNYNAFAALKSDGTVVSWGDPYYSGTPPAGLGGVTQIFSTGYAFAGLKSDGTVVCWGATSQGGTPPAGLGGVTQIFSNDSAFAALKSDGTVVSWGSDWAGGTTPAGLSGVVGFANPFTDDRLLPSITAAVTAITDNVGIIQGGVASGASTDDTSLSISGTISAALATSETVRIYDGNILLGSASVSGTNWSYADSRTLLNNQTVSYTARVADVAGNQSAAGSAYTATVDTVAPTGSLNPTASVGSTTANGSYGIGAVINLAVQFSETVFVNTTAGTPRLQLETGAVDRYAIYTGGSGTNALSFSYTVQSGDSSADLDQVSSSALELNSGTIMDAAGNNANFSLATPGAVGSLAANAAIVIATATPNSHLFSTVTQLEWDQDLDLFITGTTYSAANFMLAEVSGTGRPFQGDTDGNLNARTWEKVRFGDLSGEYLPIFTGSSYYYYYGAVNTGSLGGWGLFLTNQNDEFYLLDVDGNCNLSPGINLGSWDSWLPNTYYFETNVVCFLAGTLIATPDGERPIESLQPGDLISTAEGPQPVRFLARSTRSIAQLQTLGKMPIRINQGALGSLGPAQDSFLSPSHAIHFAGSLVEAGALINGTSIQQLDDWPDASLTYYNIELERHGLITANGLLAESYFANYRSNGFSRDCWDNYHDYVALYGAGELMEELPLPRIAFARQIPMQLRQSLQLHEDNYKAAKPAIATSGVDQFACLCL